MTQDMTSGDVVVASLLAHGIDTLYALPGVQSDHLFNAIFDTGGRMRVVHTRHEQGAAYMALGAALATGKPAAYSVVPGPGFLNTTAALSTAFATNARVLCLSGQIPSTMIGKRRGLLHEIEGQSLILEQLTKWSALVSSPQDAADKVARAFAELNSGRPRPVGLELPPDVLAAKAPMTLAAPVPAPRPAVPANARLDEAAAMLLRAARPLIYVGSGALDAAEEVKAIAELLGAPVVSFRMGRGILDDRHDLSHAIPGGHTLWKGADVVLAIGTRLQTASSWGTDVNMKIIRIEIDPAEMSVLAPSDIPILADAKVALQALLPLLGKPVARAAKRRAESRDVKTATAKALSFLEPQLSYLRAIRDVLPDDGVLVDEMTQVGYAARLAYEARKPRTHISPGYQGTLGYGAATALGAKHALGSTPLVSINGDGGFMFNVQELATAVRHRIPAVFVVFNDNAYGNVRRIQQETYGNRVIASDLVNPDFVKLADSFGVAGALAKDPAALRRTLEKALASGEPCVIEVPCGEMPSPWDFIALPKVRG
jgi:acetolactate synthase I/II/III large subunit